MIPDPHTVTEPLDEIAELKLKIQNPGEETDPHTVAEPLDELPDPHTVAGRRARESKRKT